MYEKKWNKRYTLKDGKINLYIIIHTNSRHKFVFTFETHDMLFVTAVLIDDASNKGI